MDASTPHDLGDLVRRRRTALHLSQPEAAARGGLSEATLRRIEQGKMANLRNATRTGLERALDWRHGTVDRIIDGASDPIDLETRWVTAGSDGQQVQVDADGHPVGQIISPRGIPSTSKFGSMFLSLEPDGTETMEITGTLVGINEDVAEALGRFGINVNVGDSFTANPDGSTAHYRRHTRAVTDAVAVTDVASIVTATAEHPLSAGEHRAEALALLKSARSALTDDGDMTTAAVIAQIAQVHATLALAVEES